MGVEMVPASSHSRPVHGRLGLVRTRERVALVDAAGAQALARAARTSDADLSTTRLVVFADRPPEPLAGLGFAEVALEADRAGALDRFAARLAAARAGVAVAIAGSDTLIGLARRLARDAGIADARVETELAGSASRRVQCIHCKGFVEDVVDRRIVCPGCGLTLDVRDHYSRRLAAYQAVWIGPGVAPALAGGADREEPA